MEMLIQLYVSGCRVEAYHLKALWQRMTTININSTMEIYPKKLKRRQKSSQTHCRFIFTAKKEKAGIDAYAH